MRKTSERGAALMVMVMGLAVMVGILVYSANLYLEGTLRAVSLQRDRMAGLQVLQDFALLAQKANEVFINNGGCPGAMPQYPAGSGFCWNPAANCVKNPIGANNNICLVTPNALTSAGQTMMVAQSGESGLPVLEAIPEETSRWQRMVAYFKDIVEFRKEIVASVQKDLIGMAGGEAYAARPEMHLPGVGAPDPVGPSQLTINNRGCNSPIGAWNPDFCKVCGAGANQVRCLELRVCISQSGCRNINSPAPNYFKDWFRQRIGIIPR